MTIRSLFATLVAAVLALSTAEARAVICKPGGLVILDAALGPLYLDSTPGSSPVSLPGLTGAGDIEPAGSDVFGTAGGPILRYNCASDGLTPLGSATGGPIGLDPTNNRLYAWIGGGQVNAYDRNTGALLGTFAAPSVCASDVAAGTDGCVICSAGTNSYRVPTDLCSTPGGVPQIIATSPVLESGGQTAVKFPEGTIYIADGQAGKNCTVAIPPGSCLGGTNRLQSTSGVAVNQDTGDIYTNASPGGISTIYRQNPINGALTVINSGETDTPGRMIVLGKPDTCGNGNLDLPEEECDPSDPQLGEDPLCCTSECTFAPTTTECGLFDCDTNPGQAIGFMCDGLGGCAQQPPENCDGADPQCQINGCDESEGCQVFNKPDDTVCDDSNACSTNESCQSGVCTGDVSCVDATSCTQDSCNPMLGCEHALAPPSGALDASSGTATVKRAADSTKNQIKAQAKSGAGFSGAALGNPQTDTTVTICVTETVNGTRQLLASANLTPAAQCDGQPCWKSNSALTQWKYKNKSGPLTSAQIKAGDADKASWQFVFKGTPVPGHLNECPEEATNTLVCSPYEAWMQNSAGWAVKASWPVAKKNVYDAVKGTGSYSAKR